MYIIEIMKPEDTSLEAEEVLIGILRRMSPAEKMKRIFSLCRMGKDLAMAGLRYRYPHAGEKQIRLLWAKQHLGDELFKQVYGDMPDDLPE